MLSCYSFQKYINRRRHTHANIVSCSFRTRFHFIFYSNINLYHNSTPFSFIITHLHKLIPRTHKKQTLTAVIPVSVCKIYAISYQKNFSLIIKLQICSLHCRSCMLAEHPKYAAFILTLTARPFCAALCQDIVDLLWSTAFSFYSYDLQFSLLYVDVDQVAFLYQCNRTAVRCFRTAMSNYGTCRCPRKTSVCDKGNAFSQFCV